jgi:glycosyltransferase involved in cell wall biosynthesis
VSANGRLRIFVPSASEYLNDDGSYGEGLIAWNLFSELARRGHELVVCARRAHLSAEPPFELVLTGAASRFESVEPLSYMRRVQRICRGLGGTGRFDVAHWLFPAQPQELLFVPPDGLPFVVGPKGAEWPAAVVRRRLRPGHAVRGALRPVFARERARTVGAARVLMGGTADTAPEFPAQRFEVVPFGIDASRFEPSPLPETPRILFVGRLYREKGIPELVEAFGAVRQAVPEARLEIAGDGELRAWVQRRIVELGLDDAVTMHGHVGNAVLPELLRRSTLLCLPTHWDAFGIVLLEAMAAGRPLVASDVGGPRHLVPPGGGRLVPVGDVAALAAALVEVLSDPAAAAAMGATNRRVFEERYTLERFADRIEAAYAAALDAR